MFKMRKLYVVAGLVLIVIILVVLSQGVKYIYQQAFERKMLASRDDNSTKVYLLLLDAADPDIIDYLIENDQLPYFKILKEQGTYSRLQSFSVYNEYDDIDYILSPPVFATIFTGKPPKEHGMTSHVFAEGGPEYYYPYKHMPVPSLWNIMNYYNKTVGIVGTQGNFPVDEVNGFIVSGEYTVKKTALTYSRYPEQAFIEHEFPDSEILYPKYIKKNIDRNFPKEIDARKLFDSFGFDEDFPKEIENYYLRGYDRRVKENPRKLQLKFASEIGKSNRTAYYVFIEDYNRMKLSNFFYEKYRPNLFIEYLIGLDYSGILYHTYEYTNYSDMDSPLFNYYKFFDKHIGEILHNLDDRSVLMVVSDHGGLKYQSMVNYTFRNMRSITGILFIYGGNIRRNSTIANASVYDITPTILYLMDFPIGVDMNGKVLLESINNEYTEKNEVHMIGSYTKSKEGKVQFNH